MSTNPTLPSDPQAMPLEELRAAVMAEPQPVAAPEPQPTPVAPEWGQMSKADDGTYQVTLTTGEVFKGTADEVIQKQAEAQYNTKRWAQEWKQKAEAVPVAPVQPPQQPPVPQSTPEELAAEDWVASAYERALARRLGLTVDELRTRQTVSIESSPANFQDRQVNGFTTMCPDWVETPENLAEMKKLFNGVELEYGFPTTQQLDLAWNYLKGKGLVKPMQAVPPAQPMRLPPPTPGATGSQPPSTQGAWTMPLDQLRAAAFQK